MAKMTEMCILGVDPCDGLVDAEFTHSDGRTLIARGLVTPEMDEDEFDWAYKETIDGRGFEFGYEVIASDE